MVSRSKLYLILTLMLIIISCNYVNAEIQSLPVSKINTNIQLVQTVSNSTYCNLTKITYPNNTILSINSLMTKNGNEYNYSYNPNVLGEYTYTTCCDPDGVDTCVGVSFNVKNSSPWIWITLAIIAFLFLILSLIADEELFVYLTGLFFLINGIYIIINGLDINSINELSVKLVSYSFLGLGMLFTLGAYVFNRFNNSTEQEYDLLIGS